MVQSECSEMSSPEYENSSANLGLCVHDFFKSIVQQDTEHGRLMVESNSKGKWLWNLTCLTFHFELPKLLIPRYLLAILNYHWILELT